MGSFTRSQSGLRVRVVGVEESAIGSSTMINLETDGRAEGLAQTVEMTPYGKLIRDVKSKTGLLSFSKV